MAGDQRSELLVSAAPSSASIKGKMNLIQSMMSSKGKINYPTEDYGSMCENCRCPSKIRLSRTVKRILGACLVSLITLLGSVSIDLSNSIKEWRSTEQALQGFSSCANILTMKFVGFIQAQRDLCRRSDRNFTQILLINNLRLFCKESEKMWDQSGPCETRGDLNQSCALLTHKLRKRLANVTDDVPSDFFSSMIMEILDDLNNPSEDLEISINNPYWTDVMSLHLLLRAKESILETIGSSPLPSEQHRAVSYRILTLLNYAMFTSDTFYRCWVDNTSDEVGPYMTQYQNIPLFEPLDEKSTMSWNRTMAGHLDPIVDCLRQKGYEKVNNKTNEILSTVSLKVTLLAVTCLLYPIVLVAFKQMTEWIQNYAKSLKERTEDLKKERRVAEDLLHQMLPKTVAKQLRKQKQVEAESYDQVTIFFSDIVGFTSISASCTPLQVVEMLNSLYICFDTRIESYNVYKVETIGDAYMVVSGLPERNNLKHADEIAKMSLDLVAAVRQVIVPHMPHVRLQLRAGIHTGPCVAGVVGYKMPRYCLFGDTVNTASRMESTSLPQKIHISSATYQILLIDNAYEIELRGEIEVKGKGKMKTYWLIGNKNYSIQNDSLVCHWTPAISQKKKLEVSMGSVQQSLSSGLLSETSRVNSLRLLQETSGEHATKGRADPSTCDSLAHPKNRPPQNTEDHPPSLHLPLPGFVEES
ncbi:uncharacterized protein RCH25_007835 [Pelodytes ibericus]